MNLNNKLKPISVTVFILGFLVIRYIL